MISIAIPTYRRGAILVETLERLLALEPRAAEIVVVDQTRDHPAAIEAKLDAWNASGAIRWIRLPEPSIPHAMNVALLEARSPLVLFVDDDVLPPPGLVRAHEEAYEPGVWAVVGQVLQPGEVPEHFDERTLRRGILRDIEFRFNHDTSCDVQNVIACNLSVDRERAIAVGGFDENFIAVAYRFETEFALRIVANGGRVRFDARAGLRHLKIPTGGVRAFGDHRVSPRPEPAVGDYYFALHHAPSYARYAAVRLRQNVLTRFHLRHPWAIPLKLTGEIRAMLLARRLAARGPRLIRSRDRE